MEKSKLDKKILKKFGITMGAAFSIITFLIIIRHKYSILPTSIISVIFFISAFMMPVLLKPIYVFWMKLAFILSRINTGLILFIIFYLIFTPIGLGMRLFRVDLLDKKIDKHKESYWKEKKKKEFSHLDYEKQF
jgi:hypothetical protein